MTPEEKQLQVHNGALEVRIVGDRAIFLYRKIYTYAVCIGRAGASCWDDEWCYNDYAKAVQQVRPGTPTKHRNLKVGSATHHLDAAALTAIPREST